jgi:CHAT domain-containing protein/tetratricopeptide (TPR) repeat protein
MPVPSPSGAALSRRLTFNPTVMNIYCRILLMASIAMLCAASLLPAQEAPAIEFSLVGKWRQLEHREVRRDDGPQASLNGPRGIHDGAIPSYDHDDPLSRMNLRALQEFERGEKKLADTLFRTVKDTLKQHSGSRSNPDVAIALTNWGLCKYERSDFKDAMRLLRDACAVWQRYSNGAPNPDYAGSIANLGELYFVLSSRRPDLGAWLLDSAALLLDRAIAIYGELDTASVRPQLAGCLLSKGILRESIGDHAGASICFDQVLALWRRGDPGVVAGDLHLAEVLRTISSATAYHGDRIGAESLLAESVRIRQIHYQGRDHPDVALALGDLARFHAGLGDLAGADSIYSIAVAMARRLHAGDPDSMLADLLGDQGDVRLRDGDLVGALHQLRESVGLYERLCERHEDLRVELARNRLRLGSALVRAEDYASAEGPLTDAWHFYQEEYLSINRPEHAAALKGLGLVFNYTGAYHHAGVDLSVATRMFRDLFQRRNDPGLASCLADVGNVYRERGWYVRAESLLVASVDIHRCVTEGRADAGWARALGYLGKYYQDKGDTLLAKKYFDSSLAMRRLLYHGSNPHELVEGLRDVAAFSAEMGDTTAAETLLIEAMGLLGGRGRAADMELALTGSMLGRIYLMSGEYVTAASYVEDAYRIYTRVSNGHIHPELAHSIRDMAILRSYQGDRAAADSFFGAATAMYDTLFYKGFRIDPVEGLDVIGRFAERHGDRVRAHAAFDTLLIMLPRITRQMSLTDGEEGQINLQKRLAAASRSLTSYFLRERSAEELFAASLWLKGRILSAVEWRNNVLRELDEGGRETADIRGEYVQAQRFLSSTRSALDSAELDLWLRQREQAVTLSRRLENELTRTSATLRRSLQRPTWKTIARELRATTRMVEYMRIPYVDERGAEDSIYYCAIVLGPRSQEPVLVRLCEERRLDTILHFQVFKDDQSSYIGKPERCVELYGLIWSPIDSLMKGVDSVYISPDGLLNRVAFAPLSDESGSMLLYRYQLRYLFSARDLVARGPVPLDAQPAAPSAAVFGGISYDVDPVRWRAAVASLGPAPPSELRGLEESPFPIPLNRETHAEGSLQPLGGTRAEAESTAATLSRHGYAVTPYMDEHATEEAFLRLASPTVLHAATHGYFFAPSGRAEDELLGMRAMGGIRMLEYADDPLLRSGLLLTGANYAWTLRPPVDGVADGIVSALDVAHMDLSRTSLVVLSACETGLGDLRSSEGVFGLKRAFRAAGAATVVMSLWKVPDGETQEMMALFYANWLDRGMRKADAFNAAQREMAQRSDPYFWAGFVLVGE